MKIGLKIYSPDQITLLDDRNIRQKIDFIEVMGVQSYDFAFLNRIDLPLIIHAEHDDFGVNICDKVKESQNCKSLTLACHLADKYNATYIVVHPGFIDNKYCTENQIINLLSKYNDRRILIENMPYQMDSIQFFGYDVETLGRIALAANKDICIDIAHATLAALKLSKNPLKFFKSLLSLNVKHFHISDVNYELFKDHLHLGDGDNFEEDFLSCIPKNSSLTIETSKDNLEKVMNDIDYLRKRS